MVDSSSQIDVSIQPIRHLKLASPCLFLILVVGCGPKPEEEIRGRWAIDSSATLMDDEHLALMPNRQQTVVKKLSEGMFERVVIVIEANKCAYLVGAVRRDFPCEVTRIDHREEVSLRMKRRDGRTDFMRARLIDENRMALEFEGRSLEMTRL